MKSPEELPPEALAKLDPTLAGRWAAGVPGPLQVLVTLRGPVAPETDELLRGLGLGGSPGLVLTGSLERAALVTVASLPDVVELADGATFRRPLRGPGGR
jgi:hypothetical protein